MAATSSASTATAIASGPPTAATTFGLLTGVEQVSIGHAAGVDHPVAAALAPTRRPQQIGPVRSTGVSSSS